MTRPKQDNAVLKRLLLGALGLLCLGAILLLFLDPTAGKRAGDFVAEPALAVTSAQAMAAPPGSTPGDFSMRLRGSRPPGMDVLLFEDRFRSPVSLRSGGPTDRGYSKGRGRWTTQYQYHQWGKEPFGASTPRDQSFLLNMANPAIAKLAGSWTPFETGPGGLKLKQQRVSTLPARLRDWMRTNTDKEWASGVLTTQHSFGVKPPYYVEVRLRMPKGQGLWPAVWTLGSDRRAAQGKDGAPVIEKDLFEAYGTIPKILMNSLHMSTPGTRLRMPAQRYWDTGIDQSTRFITYAMYCPDEKNVIFYNSLQDDGSPSYIASWPAEALTDQFDYLLISMGMGGAKNPTPGPPDASTPDVNELEVDYIRVWGSQSTPVYRNGISKP